MGGAVSNIKRRLDIIFDETTNGNGNDRRYIAISLDGGPGWGVWDMRTARLLRDNEVSKLRCYGANATGLAHYPICWYKDGPA
jgi:hypothetical protein